MASRKERIVQVWEVIYDAASSGPAGDGTHIARFRDQRAAERFAAQNTSWGNPTRAVLAEVPSRIAERWGMSG